MERQSPLCIVNDHIVVSIWESDWLLSANLFLHSLKLKTYCLCIVGLWLCVVVLWLCIVFWSCITVIMTVSWWQLELIKGSQCPLSMIIRTDLADSMEMWNIVDNENWLQWWKTKSLEMQSIIDDENSPQYGTCRNGIMYYQWWELSSMVENLTSGQCRKAIMHQN